MARNRMIKPEFWEDEKIGTLSLPARLLFLACLNFADDEGLIRWNTSYLNACAFVYDKFSENKVKKMMNELEKSKILQVFETKNHFFIAKIRNFKKHQRIDHPQTTRFDIDLDIICESETLKNQSEIEINSKNDSKNDSEKNSEQFPPKDNIIEVKEKLKEVKDNLKEDKVKALVITKTITPQQEAYNYFSEKYKLNTGEDFKSDNKDFIILASLIKKSSLEKVKQKIDFLEIGCKNDGVFWFAKDFTAFTIKQLSVHWNEILPRLTEEQKEQQEKQKIKEKMMADLEERKAKGW